jgi:hypothetical protein
MQRPIKFRAWDGVDYMSNPFTLQDIQSGKIQFTSDTIIMQFTGLLDKNGTEIYEGDIMSWESYEGTKNQIRWVVEFNPKIGYKTWSSSKNDEIVIGSIHSNPELNA